MRERECLVIGFIELFVCHDAFRSARQTLPRSRPSPCSPASPAQTLRVHRQATATVRRRTTGDGALFGLHWASSPSGFVYLIFVEHAVRLSKSPAYTQRRRSTRSRGSPCFWTSYHASYPSPFEEFPRSARFLEKRLAGNPFEEPHPPPGRRGLCKPAELKGTGWLC